MSARRASDSQPLEEPKPSKYRAVRTELDGLTFDSKGEAERWAELRLEEKAGRISGLRRQTQFDLGVCRYYADFTYYRPASATGELIVEDWKPGPQTEAYRLKKKLMKERYGIAILETGKPARPRHAARARKRP